MRTNKKGMLRENLIYIYYGVLLLILTSWTSMDSSPAMPLRLAYLGLVILPVFFRKGILPAVLACFTTVAFYGYAYSYMPSMLYIYAGIVLVLSFFIVDNTHHKVPPALVTLLLYVTFVNFVTGGRIEDITYSFFIFLILFLSVSKYDDSFFNRMSFVFAIVTLVLSIFFLTSIDQFATMYAFGEDLERAGWTDPNYFGTVLGMGTVFSVLQLLYNKESPLFFRLMYIAVIIVSVIVLALNASRGSVVALVGSIAVLMLFTKAKTIYKVLSIVAAAGFIVFLYNSGYMDLLIYRSLEDTASTGGGRLSIWVHKLNRFSEGGVLNILFGYGYNGGLFITGSNLGFHNDFVAALVDYGLIGFVIYLWAVFSPIVKVFKNKSPNRIVVYTLMVYFILTSFSLEPVTAGRLPYIMLLFTIYVLANQTTNDINVNKV